jgi:hypothetical protein
MELRLASCANFCSFNEVLWIPCPISAALRAKSECCWICDLVDSDGPGAQCPAPAAPLVCGCRACPLGPSCFCSRSHN